MALAGLAIGSSLLTVATAQTAQTAQAAQTGPSTAASAAAKRLCMLSQAALSVDGTRRFTLPELERQGWRVDHNMVFIARDAGGDLSRLPALAGDLASQRCDAVIAVAYSAVIAARQAMPQTPIVMGYADDPVGAGFAESFKRPGGWITGVSVQAVESDLKRLQVLRELLPSVRRIGVLLMPSYLPQHRQQLASTAQTLGLEIVWAEAGRREDYAAAFERLRDGGARALLVTGSPAFAGSGADLARRAGELSLPAICEWPEMAEAGCLASFGAVAAELRARVAHFVARIFEGKPPGEIPIEQPMRFEFVVNERVARALGVKVPGGVLLRADRVVR